MTRVGRPRASGAAASRQDAREALLDAAGELFTGAGYAATTTRAIAERAGLRQASLYYHFPAKEDILAELLAATVRPSLAVADRLVASRAPAATRLWALAHTDIRLLAGARHNVGALYLLPEIASPNLAGFRADRAALKAAYASLVDFAGVPSAAARTDLVFGLVESTAILRRDSPDFDVAAYAREGADAVLRVAGLPDADDALRAAALDLAPPDAARLA
ncbi:TetR/AcrR family transcriptional regulator [Amycolatopsis sp. FDAARGOS 1241]|uniref:TetR/AcrR family transcriptional regulator n=1 Tax=Amycolatopsis sp. FDAARGOS 1241 TaxID=2778070 RepID=UPI0019509FC3|nr:TetR/AcrR family transcriptional regulator [Amycolatopsis sp. FDAARGOS 1241]QRP50052.1 TetR/AcrR family transcriptional regulator [Amycolatopsis sp. FDAARGOS 1241]